MYGIVKTRELPTCSNIASSYFGSICPQKANTIMNQRLLHPSVFCPPLFNQGVKVIRDVQRVPAPQGYLYPTSLPYLSDTQIPNTLPTTPCTPTQSSDLISAFTNSKQGVQSLQ